MKNIVFIAQHGTGKGTQCELLKEKYQLDHLSTGDLIRDAIKKQDEFGKSLENTINQGKLVSDDIILEMIKNYIQNHKNTNGIIFDGFPRNLNQAKCLDKLLNDMYLKLDKVFYLEISKEEALKRTLGRLTCPNCKKSYNKNYNNLKPKQDGICDECGSKLVSRSDDNEEAFNNLYDVFINETKPILNYYENNGVLKTIDASLDKDEIFKNIEKVI